MALPKADSGSKAVSDAWAKNNTPAKRTSPPSDAVEAAIKEAYNKGTINQTPPKNPSPPPSGGSSPAPSTQQTIPQAASNPTPQAINKSSGLVDGVNFKQQYFDAIKEITLSLINSAKGLLTRYNFSSIDRVPDYYLEFDKDVFPTAVISGPSRPNPPFTVSEADKQDKFSLDVNEINNQISDLKEDTDRAALFGSLNGDTFVAGEAKILNGNTYYDMRIVFNSVSSEQNFVIKCYEI